VKKIKIVYFWFFLLTTLQFAKKIFFSFFGPMTPFWDLFAQIWAKPEFSRKIVFCQKIPTINTLRFSPFPAKTNDSISQNNLKTSF
jgi:hypothetical protein